MEQGFFKLNSCGAALTISLAFQKVVDKGRFIIALNINVAAFSPATIGSHDFTIVVNCCYSCNTLLTVFF